MGSGDILGRRVAAALVDAVVILVLLILIATLFGDDKVSNWSLWAETQGRPRVAFFLLTFAYFAGTELVWAQTLGKRLLGLRVVRADGSKADAGAVVIRNLVRLVDWLPFLYVVGAIAVFATGERRQRLGDLAAGTRVVVAAAAPHEPPDRPPPPPTDDDVLASVLR
jgi:uncharacterized RDD family membrane protein YckC